MLKARNTLKFEFYNEFYDLLIAIAWYLNETSFVWIEIFCSKLNHFDFMSYNMVAICWIWFQYSCKQLWNVWFTSHYFGAYFYYDVWSVDNSWKPWLIKCIFSSAFVICYQQQRLWWHRENVCFVDKFWVCWLILCIQNNFSRPCSQFVAIVGRAQKLASFLAQK